MPWLDVVALAAFLLAFGDLTEDHGWRRRIVAGSVGAGVAVAAGTLVGGQALSAAGGMLLCGVAIGLAGAYGDGAAAMALPVAWMFLELVENAHRQAGLDNTNLQATLRRVFVEPGESPGRLEATLLAVVTLQRMLVTLIALWRLGADAARPTGWAPLHACATRGFFDLARALDSRTPPSPLPALWTEAHRLSSRLAARGGPRDALMAREVERLAWQVGALRTAVARLIAASSPDR